MDPTTPEVERLRSELAEAERAYSPAAGWASDAECAAVGRLRAELAAVDPAAYLHSFAMPEHRALSVAAYAHLHAHDAADNFDSGDLWGTLMAAGFEACDEATRRGLPVPPELEYRPGAGGPEPADGQDATFLTDAQISGLLAGLDPLLNAAKSAGLDY